MHPDTSITSISELSSDTSLSLSKQPSSARHENRHLYFPDAVPPPEMMFGICHNITEAVFAHYGLVVPKEKDGSSEYPVITDFPRRDSSALTSQRPDDEFEAIRQVPNLFVLPEYLHNIVANLDEKSQLRLFATYLLLGRLSLASIKFRPSAERPAALFQSENARLCATGIWTKLNERQLGFGTCDNNLVRTNDRLIASDRISEKAKAFTAKAVQPHTPGTIRYPVPECATNISHVLDKFTEQVNTEIRNAFTTAGVAHHCNIDQINTVLLAQEVCKKYMSPGETVFYPFGGTDTFYPTLLANPGIVVMTSGEESWGRLDWFTSRYVDLNTVLGIYGGGAGGNFDTTLALQGYDEDGTPNDNTLGHLALHRAIVAHTLNGRNVTDVHIARFFIDEDSGAIAFNKVDPYDVKGNIAFWITSNDARNPEASPVEDTLYLRWHFNFDEKWDSEDSRTIEGAHKFLSKTCPEGEMLILEKAIPDGMFKYPLTKELLSPPKQLVRTIICDQMMADRPENAMRPHPIFVDGMHMVEKVDLARFGTNFGYGDMYIHAHEEPQARLDTSQLYPVISLGTPDAVQQFEKSRDERLSFRPSQRYLRGTKIFISGSDTSGKIRYDPRLVQKNLNEVVKLLGCDPRDDDSLRTSKQRKDFGEKFLALYEKDPDKCRALGFSLA